MFKIRVERLLDKDIESVFAALTDHANYASFPGVNRSELVEAGGRYKNGEGALRKIVAGPFTFIERITRYESPKLMGYLIEKSTPIPMRHDLGEIALEAVGEQTRVLWVSEGHMRIPLLGLVLDKVIEKRISKAFGAILAHVGSN